jgi:hypothetical protein
VVTYAEAIRHGYLWHEFGDSALFIRSGRASIVTGLASG